MCGAKAVATPYYKRAPSLTYMDECGGGGSRDALAMVQRHPEDLDVAAAIGFTNYGTRHGIHQMWVYQADAHDAGQLRSAGQVSGDPSRGAGRLRAKGRRRRRPDRGPAELPLRSRSPTLQGAATAPTA